MARKEPPRRLAHSMRCSWCRGRGWARCTCWGKCKDYRTCRLCKGTGQVPSRHDGRGRDLAPEAQLFRPGQRVRIVRQTDGDGPSIDISRYMGAVGVVRAYEKLPGASPRDPAYSVRFANASDGFWSDEMELVSKETVLSHIEAQEGHEDEAITDAEVAGLLREAGIDASESLACAMAIVEEAERTAREERP